ncbi:MAG: glycosyltransferase family 2 protein [Candidatus Aenigmatarchaeota archaeon]
MIELVETILTIILIPLVSIQISWIILIFLSFFKKPKTKEIKNLPKITILIPAHNEEKNLPELIENLNSLDYPKNKIEILIIENGSSDNTYKVAKELEKKYKNVKAYHLKISNKSIALNFGLEKTKSEYVLILDADTRLEKDSLKNSLKYFVDNVAGVTFSIRVKNKNKIIAYFQNAEYMFSNLLRKGLNLLKEGSVYIWGCAIIYKTKILKKVKFRELATEDIDTNLRIQSLGYKIIYAEDCIGYTEVPEKLKNFVKQRLRWYSNSFLILDTYVSNFNKMNKSLKYYSVPFLIFFWLPFSFIVLPLNAYSISYWLQYQKTLEDYIIYFINWFSFFGIINGIYKVYIGEWILKPIMIFGYASGIITFFLIIFALIYYKQLNPKNFLLPIFSFPYFFFINLLYVISFIIFLVKSNKMPWLR